LHAVLFVGDDWAEDHHDVELVDEAGTVLARKRLAEGLAGVTALHALIGEHLPDPGDDLDRHDADRHRQVIVGIETERGPWVASLIAAGYTVWVHGLCP
jgi:Transposase